MIHLPNMKYLAQPDFKRRVVTVHTKIVQENKLCLKLFMFMDKTKTGFKTFDI